jgi:hypothetical protein
MPLRRSSDTRSRRPGNLSRTLVGAVPNFGAVPNCRLLCRRVQPETRGSPTNFEPQGNRGGGSCVRELRRPHTDPKTGRKMRDEVTDEAVG